jgi:hypothetical protein
MSNPIEGQDFDVKMQAEEELEGSTVVLWYKTPADVITNDVTPTDVNTTTNIITYRIDDAVAVTGRWTFGGMITNAAGDITKIHPFSIDFDRDVSL